MMSGDPGEDLEEEKLEGVSASSAHTSVGSRMRGRGPELPASPAHRRLGSALRERLVLEEKLRGRPGRSCPGERMGLRSLTVARWVWKLETGSGESSMAGWCLEL